MRRLLAASWSVLWLACGPTPLLPEDGGAGPDAGVTDAGVDCAAGVQPSAEVVLTERGPVRGDVSAAGRAFRGLPYVKPPVGALRWRPPEEDLTCWSGVREATAWAPKCPQLDQQQGVPFDAGAPLEGDEDCLTLNVFTPADATPTSALPVLVFIHGGGNTVGAASETIGGASARLYDGTALAQRGNVVVVTLQYRLGVLGFLSLPALDAERAGGAAGNHGLLDQQAALRWVQRNARAFGGDPSRVLLFGESAGAVNTCMHLAMPASSGLFQRAILQSGSCAAPDVLERHAEGATWLGGTGCAQAADVPACLRALSPEQLIRAWPVPVVVGARKGPVSWGPTVDGAVLPKAPLLALQAGEHAKVPLIVGSNTDETSLSTPLITTEAEYRAALATLVGPAAVDQVVALYPVATYGAPRRALMQVTTDAFFGCQARHAARAAFRGQPGVPVYRYLFSRAPIPARGAAHGVELLYVFQKVSELTATPAAADLAVEASLRSAWTRFAASGRLDGVTTVPWAPYAAGEPLLRLDATQEALSGWRSPECDFWDTFVGVSVPAP